MTKAMRLGKGLLAVMLIAAPAGIYATNATAQTTDDNKSVGQDAKDAGHATKEGAKKTGSTVKKGTKKVLHKGAQKTAQGADKVQDKTKPTPSN